MKISADTWKKVDPLLDTALDLQGDDRARWLDELRTREPELAPVVVSLLDSHERAERSLGMETVPHLAAPPPRSSPFRTDETLGPFTLVRPLGRGGMGEVWLAQQSDGRVKRQVALKLPELLGAGSLRAERFVRERDILAKLEHPHIARLYDAGVSPAGQPWLAMEFVEGQPLDAYLASHPLPFAQRLALFRQVLDAVAHAHRRLVVHRDLKPANILVDAEGRVKLLDFGIAKLVDDEGAAAPADDLTRAGSRLMTLRYAAPEQAEGGELTTATDVYSLGVVLHEALTGLSPYRPVREGRPLTVTALAREEIDRPSQVAPASLSRLLAGDLDAILLKALRRDPAERYASITAFDDDIRRHLEHRPVHARAGTWRYLAGRFARRHRLPLAMAAGVVVALAAGIVVAENGRREAEAQRVRAERHLASVRELANTFLFDVHGDIEKLPGSIAARQKLLGTALKYLDALTAESGDDPKLQREIATAYRRIAQIEGDITAASTGRMDDARAHAGKAVAMLEAVDKARPGDAVTLRELVAARSLLTSLMTEQGPARVMESRGAMVQDAERLVAMPGATATDRLLLGRALAEHAFDLAVVKGDRAAALAQGERGLALLEAAVKEGPGDRASRAALAFALERLSIAVANSPDKAEIRRGAALELRAVELTEALAAEDPLDGPMAQALVKRHNNLARTLRYLEDLEPATRHAERALALSTALQEREPGNASNTLVHVAVLSTVASLHTLRAEPAKAVARFEEAEKTATRLPDTMRASLRVQATLADVRGRKGLALQTMAEDGKAPAARRLAWAREARGLFVGARTFRQGLIDQGIDVTATTLMVKQIGESIAEVDALIAKLEGGGRKDSTVS